MRRLALLLVLFCSAALAQGISPADAQAVFRIANDVNKRDAGTLWGIPVCGPIFLADPQTRDVVANQPDHEQLLHKAGNVWVGKLPDSLTISNSATDWGGVHWTMLRWPVTDDPRDRPRLIAHECFHRIQKKLKLEPADAVATHLDDKDGRIWLQLEWRALERALVTSGELRRAAIRDAISFRKYRRAYAKNAASTENALEMNEGLSEYTGFRLANPNEADRRAAAVYALHSGPDKQSFGRSFAYVSGPAYGILLDASGRQWRRGLTADTDIGELLASAYQIPKVLPTSLSATAVAHHYAGENLIASETERAVKLEARRSEVRRQFVDGPVLLLPVDDQFGYGFNPNDTLSLDENSTFYGWARITGAWGVLETNDGVLITRKDGKIVRVAVPAKPPEATNNNPWKLTLNPGWKIVPAEKDQTLKKQ